MIDIDFYMKVFDLKQQLMAGLKMERSDLIEQLETYRSPRTCCIQYRDHQCLQYALERFVSQNYGIDKDDMSENHYFLYVIPRVIVLHGYGDPLLDRNMPQYVQWMTEKGLESYFSCNPANINMERTLETFDNGLGYIKYSIESVDDLRHKEVRGQASNFSESYKNILKLLDLKAQRNYQTKIVITMINLNKPWQQDEFARLKEAFAGCDVYVYLKSQDQQWYEDNRQQTQSIHWIEFCQFPWSSMTVKSNGECAECVEDFDNEIILGDARVDSLYEIWNGDKYKQFREDHFDLTPGIKCTEQCDMQLIGSFLSVAVADDQRAGAPAGRWR
jgi:MoaA/NifB/PqqE/SkfB family radical SAM enzyme